MRNSEAIAIVLELAADNVIALYDTLGDETLRAEHSRQSAAILIVAELLDEVK